MRLCKVLVPFVIASSISLMLPIESDAAQDSRSWTVQDSVAVRYFVTNVVEPGALHSQEWDPPPFHFSPDGKHFFFQLFYGNASEDRIIHELWIYSVDDVRHALRVREDHKLEALQPLRRLVMRSGFPGSFSGAAIYQPQWETHKTITFVGATDRESRRVYRYDIESGQLTALTEEQYLLSENGGQNYAIRGSSIMFETDGTESAVVKKPVLDIAHLGLQELLSPHEFFVYHASYKGTVTKPVAEAEMGGRFGPWISPDEKWAVMVYPPKGAGRPAKWADYGFDIYPFRFMLINLQSGLTQPLIDAPAGPWSFPFEAEAGEGFGIPYKAFWAIDSRHVLLFNTALPLNTHTPQHRLNTYVVDYDVETNQWSAVDPFPAVGSRTIDKPVWIDDGRRLFLTYRDEQGKATLCKTFYFEGEHWRVNRQCSRKPAKRSDAVPDLKLSLRESANDPPVVFASDGTNEIALTGPDPALNGVWRAPVEAIEWHDKNGQPVESLLMLPRDYSKEKSVRLVIQLSDTSNPANAFRPDGEPGTAFAAQALVAQGFAVLQLEPAGAHRDRNIDPTLVQTPKEGLAQVKRVDEAVDMLRQRGTAIEAPIGLIGFSRSGYYVYYVATHPGKTRVGAAIAFDSISYGYGEYVNGVALEGSTEAWVHPDQYGGGFWQNKQAWLDAPTFKLDRLETPILFCSGGGGGVELALKVAETIGAFRVAKRPFDYQWYPDGQHPLVGAGQREAALQSTVDWMTFWLQGREREDSDQVERFARWRTIKADWEKVQAKDARNPENVSAQ